ncbi:uncharacterized protein LOC126775525 [Nymphalis io]|uniref:uncharacterized protein LOC126775525 n=1 Tax=Inachis io TaxID=171585 RepID=UPI002168BBC5|nr:uncharacterized protein LOC126775525 [Nymphalis io]
MEDFDVFTNEIEYTKPVYKNILNKYVKDIPSTPSGPNYESGRKLMGVEHLAEGQEKECAFYFSESASSTLRTLAVYRDEQIRYSDNKLSKITTYIKPVQNIIDANPISKDDEELLNLLLDDTEAEDILKEYEYDDNLPFYKRYMRFGPQNNVDNFLKILSELPKEWTIIQLTAPYNPNENLKLFVEYRTEIDSIYLTLLSNDYLDQDIGPITIEIPANVTKGEEKPLFEELYSLLDENYKTIDNAQFLNNKRLVQNYWSRREDIDLRLKSVINVMYKEWLGGWSSLLNGKLMDTKIRDRLINLVDMAIVDWGFLKLTKKQKVLLYNLLENSSVLSSQQIKSCLRKILTEHGNTDDVRKFLNASDCENCNKDFKFLNELCLKCLSKCFEKIHNFTLVDGIRAFSQVALKIRDGDEWEDLKKAKRNPVILIVDEMLDTFPWETLPIINQQPVSRIENIHFLYMLYKVHEDRIVDGYFKANADVGRYIINPEKNLERMELRMSSFVQYWCPSWSGHVGHAPPPERFVRDLADADVFLYCGHGDGVAGGGGGAGVERACGRAAALLAGCGSVRLARPPARAPAAAAHHHLHVAACPLVLGMLWEVTDLEVDKAVTALLALAVPSAAPLAWRRVGKADWSRGVLDLNVENREPVPPERDVLRAMCRARGATNFMMIASSLVARGIPVRMPDE